MPAHAKCLLDNALVHVASTHCAMQGVVSLQLAYAAQLCTLHCLRIERNKPQQPWPSHHDHRMYMGPARSVMGDVLLQNEAFFGGRPAGARKLFSFN